MGQHVFVYLFLSRSIMDIDPFCFSGLFTFVVAWNTLWAFIAVQLNFDIEWSILFTLFGCTNRQDFGTYGIS